MTHSTKAIASTILLTIVLSMHSFAQEMYAGMSMKTSFATHTTAMVESIDTKTAVAPNPLISAKLTTLVPDATNLRWTMSDDNFWVSFLNNGRKGKASFTPKGKMNYLITDCVMEQLPGAFSKAIKKQYASYHLFNAIEVTAYDAVAYQAILENPQGFITLKYTDEGMEEIQQVKKTAN